MDLTDHGLATGAFLVTGALMCLFLSPQGLVLEAWEEEVSSETKFGSSLTGSGCDSIPGRSSNLRNLECRGIKGPLVL